MGFVHWCPIVNILWDQIFDAPQLPAQLKESLNIIALVASLMLSIAGGILFSYNNEDYLAAIKRFSIHDAGLDPYLQFPYYTPSNDVEGAEGYGEIGRAWQGSFKRYTYNRGRLDGYEAPYLYVVQSYCVSVMALGGSITLVVLLYLIISSSEFGDSEGKFCFEMYVQWYKWCRWIFVLAQLFLLIGIFWFVAVLANLMGMMLPDLHFAVSGVSASKVSNPLTKSGQILSPWAYMYEQGMVFIVGPMTMAFFVISISLIRKNMKYVEVRDKWLQITRKLEGIKKETPSSQQVAIPGANGDLMVDVAVLTKIYDSGITPEEKARMLRKYASVFASHALEPEHLEKLSFQDLTVGLGVQFGDAMRLVASFKGEM